ncbi:MAG: hypothetical protein KJI71_00525 [Patescibacteria group bacterium]|nr:hypothetical protein [Patescibacteria group bacterium]
MSTKELHEFVIRESNFMSPVQYNILKFLKKYGAQTRRQLVKNLRAPRTTVYDNLIKLQKKKYVEKFSRNDGNRGRPLVYWKYKEQSNDING